MLITSSTAHIPSSQGFESKAEPSASDRLSLQTNIKGETGQHSARAVAPIVEVSLSEKTGSEKQPALQSSSDKKAEEAKKAKNPNELSEEEEKQVQELKKRDAEVKAHEQAHAAVGGSYASAPTYEYTTGPDNKQYAIGGEVQIDSAPVPNNPEATIRKMDIVIRAALAPAEPSSQDKQVAAQAAQQRAEAQAELAKQRAAELKGEDEEKSAGSNESTPTTNPQPNQDIIQAISAYETANQLFGAGG